MIWYVQYACCVRVAAKNLTLRLVKIKSIYEDSKLCGCCYNEKIQFSLGYGLIGR